MRDIVAEIHQQLNRLDAEHKAAVQTAQSNRAAAIALIHFVSEVIRTIAPGKIDVEWYGSYSTPGVYDYPAVRVCATWKQGHHTLAEWKIDAGGAYPPPTITQEMILDAINEALSKVII